MNLMSQITGVITRAEPRTIERRDGSGSFPLYEVWIDGQGPFVARKDVFNQAQALVNAQVEAITRTEQKGQYTNYYLDFVEQRGVAGNSQQSYQQGGQTQAMTAAEQVNTRTAAEERTNISIHRQVAAKVAAKISTNAQDFWVNIEDLFIYFQTGKHPYARHAVTPDPIPHENRQNADAYRQYREEPDNQYVPQSAYQDPGSQLPPPDDSDLPF